MRHGLTRIRFLGRPNRRLLASCLHNPGLPGAPLSGLIHRPSSSMSLSSHRAVYWVWWLQNLGSHSQVPSYTSDRSDVLYRLVAIYPRFLFSSRLSRSCYSPNTNLSALLRHSITTTPIIWRAQRRHFDRLLRLGFATLSVPLSSFPRARAPHVTNATRTPSTCSHRLTPCKSTIHSQHRTSGGR